jgi:alpha-glucosidase (family GH31 glycosyl hydrolase)
MKPKLLNPADFMKNQLLILACLMLPVASSNAAGRQPPRAHAAPPTLDANVILPPAWAFGILYGSYRNQQQSIQLVDDIIKHDYPIDAFWTDSWIWDWANGGKGPKKYIDFVADTESYPNMKAFWTDYLGGKKIKAGMWVWDCIQLTGNEEAYQDFKSRGYFRDEFVHTSGWHNGSQTTIIGDHGAAVKGTWTGNINFDRKDATDYFKQRMKHFFDKGIDFIKLDKTDAIPVCKAMFEMSQELGLESKGRGFVLSHSAGVDREEFKNYPAKWTDDTRSDWSVKTPLRQFSPWLPKVAFQENIAMYTDLSMHHYKTPFLANDMGGFAVSTDGFIDEELYIRWLQFAMFVPLTTPFSQPENKSGNIAFLVSERADANFRKYSHLKMELFPYIYTYAHRSRLDGVNTIRPIAGHLYQYLFGEEMLVAPVCEQNARTKAVYLPAGNNWYDSRNGRKYTGGQSITVDAPLDEIPVLVKEGAIILRRDYARSIELGNNDVLTAHVYPGSDGTFTLIEDDGASNDYLKGIYAKTVLALKEGRSRTTLTIAPTSGGYQGMPESRTWRVQVHGGRVPVAITNNGKKLPFQITDGAAITRDFSSPRMARNELQISY